MNARRGFWIFALVCGLSLTGCRGLHHKRNAAAEPALDPVLTGEPGSVVVPEPIQPTKVGWASRHPLFTKPGQYYKNTDSNVVVKGAAATFVGVPAGIVGEVKQIVVGKPVNPAPY